MILVALGLGVLVLLLWAARGFSRARVATVKSFGAWLAALAGLSLAALLLLTGRGGIAISGALLFGPLIWNWWKQYAGARLGTAAPARRLGPMSRAEALDILGLADPVSESDVRAAYVELMRRNHPDAGGSVGLAARINQARDVLLGRR